MTTYTDISPRMFHVVVINEATGKKVRMTSAPVTHKEGCTLLSKITDHEWRRKQLEEAAPASYLEAFTAQYLTAALWAETDDNDLPLNASRDTADIAPGTKEAAARDCGDFLGDGAFALLQAAGVDATQAGHDYWLTRNGHGAGYWDRDLGDAGDQLTALAEARGPVDAYVGDEGLVHIE